MRETVRTADSKRRIAIPGFADETVIIEKIDDAEYRVRKAKVIPERALRFHEEGFPVELSKRDAAKLVELLAAPPVPNQAARRAARKFRKHQA